ncbi:MULTISPECIES: opacity family porin [Pasteurellaceae]|uniref:Opacity family porin protein n=1 Tax=Pasteurella bettyae CCUG 2042 TaxID=1095749 RepID=I3D7W8_9PAST|nr:MULTISPECIES: opacity family porin [Pasteurellaceae]EIJ67811.1 opacity family porin protein [Pasteurella bettyae CCUG 2042]SUB22154.1 porin, opacity type [Pasteurella bettyae]
MKKTLLAIISALAIVSTAQANIYVEGNAGMSKIKSGDVSKSRFTPSVAVGYDTGDFRYAIDYTHYGKSNAGDSHVKTQGIGASAIYDIEVGSPVKPYVGVRVSANNIDAKEEKSSHNLHTIRQTDSYKLGYGAMAGVQYKVAKDVSLNGGIEYNRLGRANEHNINQYGAKAGIRYDF